MLIDLKTLPEDIASLKQTIVGMAAAQAELEQKYRSQIDYLQERIRLVQNELFGRRTEKRPMSEDAKQLKLFNEAEVLCPETAAEDEEAAQTMEMPAHTRKKPKRKPLAKDLPRVKVIHDLSEEEKICACGTPLSRIGQQDSEKLDIVPAKIQVIRATMAGWMVKSAQACEPVMELFHNVVLSGPVVNVDETLVQVMKEPGRSNSSKSYMWVYCGGPTKKPVGQGVYLCTIPLASGEPLPGGWPFETGHRIPYASTSADYQALLPQTLDPAQLV